MADLTGMMQAAAGGAGGGANYIEDVFSTYLYPSTSSTDNQIVNGIDLAGEGGMVWIKSRTRAASNHYLVDTVRGSSLGVSNTINSNTTNAQATGANLDWVQFNSNGFTAKAVVGGGELGTNTYYGDMVGWTFRKQPKFFDVVTYTGNGSDPRNIAHNLGSVPGSMIIKCTSTGATDWFVYHRSLGNSQSLNLNQDGAAETGTAIWGTTTPTSTVFTVGNINANTNARTYVAYLFAHDAGGFGLSGEDNVVSCGGYTGTGVAGLNVTLGYEPQWLMVKHTNLSGNNWFVVDTMRGFSMTVSEELNPNNSNAGNPLTNFINPTATGFNINTTQSSFNASGSTYIYIAIRRGPMKVPTDGTSVFGLSARTGTGANATVTGSAGVSDAVLVKNRGSAVASLFSSRLTNTGYLVTSTNAAEVAAGTTILQANPWDVMDGVKVGTTSTITNASAATYINYLFDRAPSFMDVVCYTGTGGSLAVPHNLAAVPELIIVKRRDDSNEWIVFNSYLGPTKFLNLNRAFAEDTLATMWNNTAPTATNFTIGSTISTSAATYVSYLFATCAGVSKVGSYTGTGTTLAINCGFTTGARFVMIKRTDSTGGWYVWDSARGIIAGNDPYLLLNTADAEATSTDYVDTSAAGFELTSTAPAEINASGGSFVFLAIS